MAHYSCPGDRAGADVGIHVRIALGRKQPDQSHLADASALLAHLLQKAEAAGWIGSVIEILVLQAVVYQALDETRQALLVLGQALSFQLIVSLNAARSHMKNIYGKLGVHNRTQAIAKAHALKLL